VPMIGGMVSSTLLTLIVIPAIYAVVKGIAIRSTWLAPSLQQTWSAEADMMHDMMNMMDGMGHGIALLLLVLVLVLAVVALVKYVFFKWWAWSITWGRQPSGQLEIDNEPQALCESELAILHWPTRRALDTFHVRSGS
jgi:hypothetical protein